MKLLGINILILILLLFSYNYCYTQKYGSSIIDSLNIAALQNIKNDTAHINTLCKLSAEYLPFNVERGRQFAEEAMKLSRKINYAKGQAESNTALGLYYWLTSDFVNSFKFYLPALDFYLLKNDSSGISKMYNNLGMLYGVIDYSEKSLNYFYKALDYCPKQNIFRRVQILTNIAGIYKLKLRTDMAINYYKEALSLLNPNPNPILEEQICLNMAVTYTKKKLYFVADQIFKRTDSLAKIILNPFATSVLKFEKANFLIQYLTDTSSIKQRVEDIGISKSLGLNKSIKEIIDCIDYFKSINSLASIAECYRAIYVAYKGLNNSTKALYYFENNNLYNDSISIVNMASKLTILETEREILIKNKQYELNKLDADFERKVSIISCVIAFLILLALFAMMALFVNKVKQSKLLIKKNEEISITNIQLEKLVAELSDKQTEIEKTNAKLNEANASKDKFFSIISHDLRSPFTGIIGLSDLLHSEIDKLAKSEIQSISRNIYSTAKNTFELFDSLLQWSRSQLGAVEFYPKKHKVAMLIEKSCRSLKVLAENKNIKMTINQLDDTILQCDDEMILTVLRNLISNSIKFTNANGLISISASVEAGNYKITVSDNGVGMDPNTLNSLFRLDRNITNIGTNNEKGSGFGLLLCKEFVEKHKGAIWAESKKNMGTKFHFTIPLEN